MFLFLLITGRQLGEVQLNMHQNELVQYYQHNIEISEANSLKPFVEVARDGVGAALVAGNGELFRQALEKQQDVERKQKQLEKLESNLGIRACHTKRTEASEEGKSLGCVCFVFVMDTRRLTNSFGFM